MSQLDDYKKAMMETARVVWGEEAEQAKPHIEAVAESVWRLGELELQPKLEPVTKLRHGEQT